MNARALIVIAALVLSACAHSPGVLLSQDNWQSLPDDDLLVYYYRLRVQAGDTGPALAGMQARYNYDRWTGGNQGAAGNLITQVIIAAGGQALRDRAILARVELERRGWNPVNGFPQRATENLPGIQPSYAQFDRGSPVGAAPRLGGIAGESKYMYGAEAVARGLGCAPPATAMTAKGAGSESFVVGCPNGTTLAIRCEIDGCRVLQ